MTTKILKFCTFCAGSDFIHPDLIKCPVCGMLATESPIGMSDLAYENVSSDDVGMAAFNELLRFAMKTDLEALLGKPLEIPADDPAALMKEFSLAFEKCDDLPQVAKLCVFDF